MRITGIELNGFRGFTRAQRFDLDADAVVVVGANGRGKTSLFDGILWALSGRVPRLGENSTIVSMYSSTGEARVTLNLDSGTHGPCTLLRSFDGRGERLRFEIGGQVLQEEAARVRLLEEIWPDALVTPESGQALTAALTRSVYLQQDLVREFVDADTDQERFNAVSELVGTGRITDLHLELERARSAWVRATNQRIEENQSSQARLIALEGRVQSSETPGDSAGAQVELAWSDWWKRARSAGLELAETPVPSSVEGPQALNSAIKQFDALRRSDNRKQDIAAELLRSLETQAFATLPDVASLRLTLEQAEDFLAKARTSLDAAERRAAEARRAAVEAREARAQLRALAQLALQHLSQHCPVCEQTYDRKKTQQRLEQLAQAAGGIEQENLDALVNQVRPLALVVETRDQERNAAASALADAERILRDERLRVAQQDRLFAELGLEPGRTRESVEAVRRLLHNLAAASQELDAIRRDGEALSLMLAEAGERARHQEIQREAGNLRARLAATESELRARQQTADLAARILESLREASSDVVVDRLNRISPLLQRIYARVDPHPAFRAVSLLARISRRRGRLDTVIHDALTGVSSESPAAVLSSSQMNALAVCVFLAFNLGMNTLPLETAILDDPLQSLDDVNLLGMTDLLRRTRDSRQLLISTHDLRFGRLLERKLRPVIPSQRTVVIELGGWDREGPSQKQYDVSLDGQPFRVVA